MSFWHMQLHPSNQKAFPPKKVKEILEKTSCIGVGDWDKGERIIDDFEKTLKKGDIVAVKSGKTPIALVEIISDCERTDNVNNDLDWFQYRRKIKVLDFYKPEYKFNIPDSRGTLKICRDSNAETTKIIKKWYEKIKSKIYMKELLELLKANKNLILTGAPGTGKTYLAKEIAKEMIGAKTDEDLLNSDQFGFVQFHPSYDYTDFVEGLRPTKPDENGNIGFELKDGIFKKFCQKAKDKTDKNFVFIIDEINRGEISKIFGELFFSIDPDYRGEKGSVKTQYSNLHEEINEMFYVPENVFIIGTMNDIDRSVESFDFAMRRRFVWREITAEESQQMFNNESWKEEAIKRMNKLNEAIGNIEGLNSSYHIGAAYFKNNLTKYNNDNDKWNKLWDLHLKPLLSEYLRGMSDQEKKLQSLVESYNLK